MKTSYASKNENYQGRSKKDGDAYENCIESYLCSLGLKYRKNENMKEIGIRVDFSYELDGIDCYVECKGGRKKDTAGALRTDNVKKAVANGALLKSIYPNARYIGYFSAPPKPGSSSDLMIQVALKAKFFDEVVTIPD